MKHLIRCLWLLILIGMISSASAQAPLGTAFAIQMGDDGVPQIGEVALSGGSLFVDWNPQSNSSLARIDEFGFLRFAPINSPEGVYTFSPYFQGFTAPSREENRLLIEEAKWSPNGQQIAFRISSGHEMGNDGIWFWQPAMETSTDPSYHLLRDCPPGCGLANARDTIEWKSLSIDWSPDNIAILSHLYLPDEERKAIGLVFASREPESQQADIQPPTYRYEYGSWATDGEQLVVSGYNPDGTAVVGMINRDGSLVAILPASDMGLAYVRNAVQSPTTGQIVMLGSPLTDVSPVAIYDTNGVALSPPIGNLAPDHVEWSPNRDAVLVRAGNQTYIATINGEVYDISGTVGNNPMVSWAEAGFPPNTTPVNLPQPATIQPTETPVLITITADDTTPSPVTDAGSQSLLAPQTNFQVGQLLQVATDSVTVYAEPIINAEVKATLSQGDALVLIGNPLTDGVTVWWRIQTLDSIGWIEEAINGTSQISP